MYEEELVGSIVSLNSSPLPIAIRASPQVTSALSLVKGHNHP